MHILFSMPYGTYAVFGPEHAPMLAALSTAKLVKEDGPYSDMFYVESTEVPEVKFVANIKFEPMPEPMVKIQERAANAETRWLEQYNKANALEKEVKALKEKLQSVAQSAEA